VVAFIAVAYCSVVLNQNDVEEKTQHQAFVDFMIKYKKSYKSSEEQSQRFRVFQDNLKIAAELDQADPSADYGVTQFMDLSREEFKVQYLISNFTSQKKQGIDYPVLPPLAERRSIDQYPSAFDWGNNGDVTPVYDQGSCGSCWAFSTTENVESMWSIAGKGLQQLSMQQLVDCSGSYGNEGCNGGNPPWTYPYIIAAGGMDSFAYYPYVGYQENCQFNSNEVVAAISTWGYITTNDDETYMLEWLYANGPPSVCVDASSWQYYTGGIITGNCGDEIDHCVQVTGYQTIDGINAWNVRNSWGTQFGYSGYLYIMRGADVCAIGNEVTSSII